MARNTQTRLDAFLPKTSTSPRRPSKSWKDDMPEVTDTPLEKHPLRVYVLCGVVGSGKSTLAIQWEALYPNNYVRVNQDSLGDRRKCESSTRDSLLEGKSPIIDRQNFDPSQRYHWLNIGHELGAEVIALIFGTTKRTCADRLLLRTGHETIKSAEQGLQVLNSMTAISTAPNPAEGFHKIVSLPPGLPLHYSIADINALLAKVELTGSLPAVLPPQPSAGPPRGAPWARGNGRGRGAFRGGTSARGMSSARSSPWTRKDPQPHDTSISLASATTPSDPYPSQPHDTSISLASATTPYPSQPHDTSISLASATTPSDPYPSHQMSFGQRNGRSPPMRLTGDAARQASQPYRAPNRLPAVPASTSVPFIKKGPSTDFIDVSSDDEK